MRRPLALLGAGAAVLAVAPAAFADERIEAAASNRYTTPQVTIDQGERLTFLNRDFTMHDVTAVQTEGGKPLFATPLLQQGQEALVEGSQHLTTGSYAFLCSVHPEMKGSITVTSAGTPVPRPGGGGGGGGEDTSAPAVTAALKTGTVRKARKDRAVKVAVTSDEAVTLTIRATAGGRTLASRKSSVAAGATKVFTLRLDRRDLRRVRKGRRLSVRVTASDAAGNKRVAKASRKLR